ncbi:sunset domain-containing protein [Microlunatus parietis]|uniref:Vacuolar-type H+-ATPase subunit E/Vma4 n=1 Tax=Microlunatus parietis TaxID=682979 RepID=A0A7Y9LG51_9ACTN|nr:hypothetical protein [Microlunatus parietis]NYE74776.1 vacuolar-type H+-ATPase subunit E/Vma4 [Microlunatus parietis]
MTPLAQSAFERVNPYVEQAVERVGPYAAEARKRGAKAAHDAVEKFGPRLDEALERVSPAVEAARLRMNEELLPKLTEALNAAAGSQVVVEAGKRGRAVVEAAKGELEPIKEQKSKKKGRWIKRIAIVAVVAGVAAVVVKKLLGSSDQGWQAARPSAPYAPTPPTPSSPWSEPAGTAANGHRPAADTAPVNGTGPVGVADDSPTEEIAAVTDEPADVPATDSITADSTSPELAEPGDPDYAASSAEPADVTEESDAGEPASEPGTESDPDAALRAKYNGEGVYVGAEPPAGFTIKGNERSMKYHLPEAAGYNRTIAEVWFNSEEAAQAAGFVRAQR